MTISPSYKMTGNPDTDAQWCITQLQWLRDARLYNRPPYFVIWMRRNSRKRRHTNPHYIKQNDPILPPRYLASVFVGLISWAVFGASIYALFRAIKLAFLR